jgi:hypothetical protein
MPWIIGVTLLSIVGIWLAAAVAVGDLSVLRRQRRPDAPAGGIAPLSGAHSAALGHVPLGEWHGYPDGYVLPEPPSDLGAWRVGDPIVVTRIVRHEGGYGWLCAECQSTWTARMPTIFVYESIESAQRDLTYHAENECTALEPSATTVDAAIPSQQLHRHVPEYFLYPEDCDHLNGQIKMPGEAFGRCAHCGTPGVG